MTGAHDEDEPFDLAASIEAGLKEAIAWKRGEITLETRVVNPMPATRVKEIRKAVAKSTKEFERRFGIPARTVEGWEQGRNVDVTGRVLLRVIEQSPEAVELALLAASLEQQASEERALARSLIEDAEKAIKEAAEGAIKAAERTLAEA